MKQTWKVDGNNAVELRVPRFGKRRVIHNGHEIQTWRGKRGPNFALTDGRRAQAHVKSGFMRVELELRVDGQLVRPLPKDGQMACPSCGADIGGLDRFCDACGAPLTSAEAVQLAGRVNEASKTIGILAVLFLVSGVLFYFLSQSAAETTLAELATLPDDEILNVEAGNFTVAEVREQVVWESRAVLIINLILAAMMGGLFQWSKRAPFPAIVVATATYFAVIIGNALLDPATLAQGVILKIIIIAFLFRGLKSALALRTATA